MSSSDPYSKNNPYLPPLASLEESPGDSSSDLADVEAIRTKHLGRETTFQFIGAICILVAISACLGLLTILATVFFGVPRQPVGPILISLAVFYGVVTVVFTPVGFGLRQLRPWTRWIVLIPTMVYVVGVLAIFHYAVAGMAASTNPNLFLAATAVWMFVTVYLLHLFMSAKGKMVISPEYREVIDRTPYIKHKLTWVFRLFFILLLARITLPAVGAMIRYLLFR